MGLNLGVFGLGSVWLEIDDVIVKQDNNVVVRTWGTPREESGLVNHVDLVNKLGIVELEAGNLWSGYICLLFGVAAGECFM